MLRRLRFFDHILQLKPDSENALYMLSMALRRTNPEESKKLQQEFEAQEAQGRGFNPGESAGQ